MTPEQKQRHNEVVKSYHKRNEDKIKKQRKEAYKNRTPEQKEATKTRQQKYRDTHKEEIALRRKGNKKELTPEEFKKQFETKYNKV